MESKMDGLAIVLIATALGALICSIILGVILVIAAFSGISGGFTFLSVSKKLSSKNSNPNTVLFCKLFSAIQFIIAILAITLLIAGVIYSIIFVFT